MIRFFVVSFLVLSFLIGQETALFGAGSDVQTVNPGDSTVDGSFIVPYRNAWRLSQKTGDGEWKILGRWTDEVTLSSVDGETQLHRKQRFPGPMGHRILINRVRQADLIPRSFEVTTDEGQILQRVVFEKSGIRVTAMGQTEASFVPLDHPVFDWFLYGVLIAGFPLAEGYEVKFPALNMNLQPTTRTLKVASRELIAGPDGKPVACWKVNSDDGFTFWVSKQVPYIFRVRGELPGGTMRLWEIEGGPGFSNYLEFRVYPTQKGQRDPFLDYFEAQYLESQEAQGMRIWGQFKDLNHAENFVWMRGYRSMAERKEGLLSFYTGDHWQKTSPKLAQFLVAPPKHIHFLEPISPERGFDHRHMRVDYPHDGGVVVALFYRVEGALAPLVEKIQNKVISSFTKAGGKELGLFRSSNEANNFPALPFIEDEKVMVWFSSFESQKAFEAAIKNIPPELVPFESFLLEPGMRSRLYHRSD